MIYHSKQAIQSELDWLLALRRDTDIPFPKPVPTPNGEYIFDLPVPGSKLRRYCTLLKWLDGRFYIKKFTIKNAIVWGKLMARLHNHAIQWRRPNCFTRPERDWEGIFTDKAKFDFPVTQLMELIPKRYKEAFDEVSRQLKSAMKKLGKKSNAFGLIHADLNIKTNVLFNKGKAAVIDFDDCCFSYWLTDFAFALSAWQGSPDRLQIQDAFFEGYNSIRTFPESQLKYLELFLAGFNADLMLWTAEWLKQSNSPDAKTELNNYGNKLLLYFK
jgi:Ser/Thr protein kinase RdoA (MazF antagonist)